MYLKPELIKSRGFGSTAHTVVTDDGYILTLFRMIKPQLTTTTTTGADDGIVRPSRGPVLLWHGISFSSDIFLVSNRGQLASNGQYSERNGTLVNDCQLTVTSNLAFTLSACGYDVWLGNTRGNQYSDKYIDNSIKNYWNYTFTELGMYDLKNSIDYIRKFTGKSSVAYVGHSMGTTSMLVLLSLEPDYHQYVKPVILMAPIAYLSHTKSLSRLFAPFSYINVTNTIGFIGEPRPRMQYYGQYICTNPLFSDLCKQMNFFYNGYDPDSVGPDDVPITVAKSLQYMSVQLPQQYGQFILSDRFQRLDLGSTGNWERYGQLMPPDYPIELIRSTYLVLMTGPNDLYATPVDVKKLTDKLTVKPLDDYLVPNDYYNHADFTNSIDNYKLINPRILMWLKMLDV
ncbi:lipase 3-like [Oppia nitens]|uniref:lipase 3-like n=1 Tax=Oppia nitens TaxID=1686743 RepID=UPI0023DCCADA|nr:lipase 3-like [Oppia nitens]